MHYYKKIEENSEEYVTECLFLVCIRNQYLNVIFHSKQNVVQAMWLNDNAKKI